MSPAKKVNATKKEIIQVATHMFLEKGFTDTSVKSICDQLGISTGNLTFHYPTKEDLLAVLVQMLGVYQWKMMGRAVHEGNSSVMAFCLELPAMASICETNHIGKDFYLSAYTYPKTLEIIRANDVARAKRVFAPYCKKWDDGDYIMAEDLVSGIEYATLMTTSASMPLEQRVNRALDVILGIFGVPMQMRQSYIRNLSTVNYRNLGNQVLDGFIQYVHEISEADLEKLIRGK